MQRKKGFTLIELLAVIVILAIISSILIPIVISTVERVRENAFLESVKGIVDSAEIIYAKDVLENNERDITFTYEEGVETATVPDLELNYKGKKPASGKIIIKADGSILIALSDGIHCVSKLSDSEEFLSEKIDVPTCVAKADTGSSVVINSSMEHLVLDVSGHNDNVYSGGSVKFDVTQNTFLVFKDSFGDNLGYDAGIDADIDIPYILKYFDDIQVLGSWYDLYSYQFLNDPISYYNPQKNEIVAAAKENGLIYVIVDKHNAFWMKIEEEILDTPYYLSEEDVYMNQKVHVHYFDKDMNYLGVTSFTFPEEGLRETYRTLRITFDNNDEYTVSFLYYNEALDSYGQMDSIRDSMITIPYYNNYALDSGNTLVPDATLVYRDGGSLSSGMRFAAGYMGKFHDETTGTKTVRIYLPDDKTYIDYKLTVVGSSVTHTLLKSDGSTLTTYNETSDSLYSGRLYISGQTSENYTVQFRNPGFVTETFTIPKK